jgi:streptogramin lyase
VPPPGVAPEAPPAPSSSPTEVVLVLSSYFGGEIHLFDPATGEVRGVVKHVPGAQTVAVGPDGAWYACAELDDAVVRIDPATLRVSGSLVADDPATAVDEAGGLSHPDAATFGPDGRLYVSSYETDQVLRYEADGTFVDAFVDAGVGGLDEPDLGLSFAPNGDLVVPGYDSDRVHRYDAQTGAPLPDRVSVDDGLAAPRAIRFDGEGRAYVASHDSGQILRVDPDGAVTAFAALPRVAGLALDEVAGVLYASSDGDDTVHAFDLATGDDLGVRVDFRPVDGATALELLDRHA